MRRSKSAPRVSSIPLPVSLAQGTSGNYRSKLSTRLSRQLSFEGINTLSTPLVNTHGHPSDGSTFKYNRSTPYGSSAKSTRTGSSFGCKLGSGRGKSPSTAKKLVRPTDKKWVEEQFIKVKNFIQTSGLFNPDMANKIRPPSMATFVALVGILLGKLVNTIPINAQNCTEEVLKWLKTLGYPGPVTASTLKTVYTSHGWPQFVSIVSWLIDRLDLSAIEDEFRLQLDPSEQMSYNLRDALIEYFRLRCGQSSDLSDEESIKSLDDRLYDAFIQIMGVNCDEVQKTSEVLAVERAQFENIDSQVKEIEDRNAETEAQNLEMAAIIQEYEEKGHNKEQEIEEELKQLKVAFQKQTERKEDLIQSVAKLENEVAQQQFTVTDRERLIAQIDDQKRLLERKQKQMKEFRTIRDEMELKLRNLVTQVETNVDKWNANLKKTFLPELTPLLLREKGFFSKEDFLKEINEVHSKKPDIVEKLLVEYQNSRDELAALLKRKEALVEENILMDADQQKLELVKAKISAVRQNNQQLIVEIEEARKKHEIKLNQLEEEWKAKVHQKAEEIERLKTELLKTSDEMETKCKCYVAKAVELRTRIITETHEIQERKKRMIDEGVAQLEEATIKSSELLATLEKLRQIRTHWSSN